MCLVYLSIRDRENMRRELEKSQEKEVEITKVKDKLQEEFSQSEVARGQAQLLRQKFQVSDFLTKQWFLTQTLI